MRRITFGAALAGSMLAGVLFAQATAPDAGQIRKEAELQGARAGYNAALERLMAYTDQIGPDAARALGRGLDNR